MKIARLDDAPEIFLSVQGEGKSAGRPCVFVRASLCNLHCVWCDTDYTWNWVGTPFAHRRDAEPGYRKFDRSEQIVELTPDEVVEIVDRFNCRSVVLTGGEPMLQQSELVALMKHLRSRDGGYWFEVETNGTIVPTDEFDALVNQYNVSPKTSNSGIDRRLRLKDDALESFARCPKATFKFVVADVGDLEEVLSLVQEFRVAPERVYLMPEGTRSDTLRSRQEWIIEQCKRHGLNFSDRLQVHVYGDRRGV